jgi:K+-sensing histidine kinase KdpD
MQARQEGEFRKAPAGFSAGAFLCFRTSLPPTCQKTIYGRVWKLSRVGIIRLSIVQNAEATAHGYHVMAVDMGTNRSGGKTQSRDRADKRSSAGYTTSAPPLWRRYAAALLMTGASAIVLWLLRSYFPLHRFPVFYALPVIVAAYLFGARPAIPAFVLSLVAFDYLFVRPNHSLLAFDIGTQEWAGLVAFLLLSVGGSAVALLVRRQVGRIRNLVHDLRISNDALSREIAEHKRSQKALMAAEEHKLEFYRQTIRAATGGKLIITDRQHIQEISGQAEKAWSISSAVQLAEIRREVAELARADGMDEARIGRLCMSIGEAATNALKHVGEGRASIHKTQDGLVFVVSDKGPGISALRLPDVALTDHYSTAGTLGMGYKIMIAFSDRVYLASEPGGTTVAVEMNLHQAETAVTATGLLGLCNT